MNVNVNVNQMARQTHQTSQLSCLEILKTLTARQVIHYWNQYTSLSLLYLYLFPRKREERKEIPNICHHVHCSSRPVLLRISILLYYWCHQIREMTAQSSPVFRACSFPQTQTVVDYWCEYSIPSCCLVYQGIDPILISGWPGSPLTELS